MLRTVHIINLDNNQNIFEEINKIFVNFSDIDQFENFYQNLKCYVDKLDKKLYLVKKINSSKILFDNIDLINYNEKIQEEN